MASIDSGGGGGRKRVDHDVPLVPFIDLLLCTVMFLLVTAVWAEVAGMPATQSGGAIDGVEPPAMELLVTLSSSRVIVASTLGDEAALDLVDAHLDTPALVAILTRHRSESGRPLPVKLLPDDDVSTALLVETMDTLRGEGFASIAFPNAAGG